MRIENLYFTASGGHSGGQVKQLEIFDYFNLLSWEEVKNHLSNYPAFGDAVKQFSPGIRDEIWRPRDVEVALYNVYNNQRSAVVSLKQAKDIIKADVEKSISNHIGAVTDEELEDIISNTIHNDDNCATLSRDTLDAMQAYLNVPQKLFDCNLGVVQSHHKQYRLQEPAYLGNLIDQYSQRLNKIAKTPGMMEREKMLSIDGGGAAGIVPLRVLNFIEKHLSNDKKIINVFDRIVGTSAGGIISLGLMAGFNTDELTDVYLVMLRLTCLLEQHLIWLMN